MHRHRPLFALSATIAMSALAAEAGSTTETQGVDTQPTTGVEYSSLTVTIDHLVTDPNSASVNVKTIWSTDTADEAIHKQIDYFRDNGRLRIALGQEEYETVATGYARDVIYIFTPNEDTTNIIADTGLLGALKHNPDFNPELTELGLHQSLIAMAIDARRTARDEGRNENLVVWVANDPALR